MPKKMDFAGATTSQDWGSAIADDDQLPGLRPTLEPIDERDRLHLAKWLLLGVAVIFVLGGVANIMYEDRGASVFDTCKTVLPPIATLVIGYYFAEKSSGKA
jgi:hypothetical protein